MKLSRLCGHVLLWSGFLGGAFVTVRSTEAVGQPWATISWPSYLAAVGWAVAGVALLRSSRRTARLASSRHAADIEQMEGALRRLLQQLDCWRTELSDLAVHQVHRWIDQQLSDDLALFSDLRESLVDAFGLTVYAEIMTEFASAERTINRMWSASADGYVDEVKLCLERSLTLTERALQRLQAARSSPAPCGVPRPSAG